MPGVSVTEGLKAWKEQCSSKPDLLNNSSLSYALLLPYCYLAKNITMLLIIALADTIRLLEGVVRICSDYLMGSTAVAKT